MCVIIYIPKESTISRNEVFEAWNTNPHGGGYCIQKDGKVHFKRGFMDFNSYYEAIEPFIGNYNLVLHLRISTSKAVNKVQTHPYKKTCVTLTEGITDKPVICMNGIISGQREYLDCNDTMSYIIDHSSAFSRVNQDILNIIESDTDAKWCVMKPDEVLLSSKFVEYEGRWYSNKNHLIKTIYYSYPKRKAKESFVSMIKDFKLRQSIKKDKELFTDVKDFIDLWCNGQDKFLCEYYCTKCLKNAKTLRDVKITLNENYYYQDEYDLEEDTFEDYCCCGDYNLVDYWYDNDKYNNSNTLFLE